MNLTTTAQKEKTDVRTPYIPPPKETRSEKPPDQLGQKMIFHMEGEK